MRLLTLPALSFARAMATSGARPEPHYTGLNADGTPVVPCLADLGVTPNQLRISELASNYVPGKVLRGNGKLNRFGGNKAYVVEVLEFEENLPHNTRVVYVQTRTPNMHAQRATFAPIPKEDKDGEITMVKPDVIDFSISTPGKDLASKVGFNAPCWPPPRVVFSYTKRADMKQLRQCLSEATGIPVNKVRAAKLFTQKKKLGLGMWRELSDSRPTPVRRSRRKKGKRHAGGPANLVEAPFLLRDGDLLAVSNSADDPDKEDNWLRPEDYRAIARAEILDQIKRESRAAYRNGQDTDGIPSGGSKRKPAREIPFRIHVIDYEASSDEDSSDDEATTSTPTSTTPAPTVTPGSTSASPPAPPAAAAAPAAAGATPPALPAATTTAGTQGESDVDPDKLDQVVAILGSEIERPKIVAALRRSKGNVQEAINALL